MRTLAVDFETYYRSSGTTAYSIASLGNWAYVHNPEFDAYMVSVSDGEQTWAGKIEDLDWQSLQGARIVSHNASFDRAVYARLVEQGRVPAGLLADWQCTANLTSFLCNRRALAAAAGHLLNECVSKTLRAAASGKTWADFEKDGSLEAMLRYARGDAALCHRLWTQYAHQMPAHEHRLSELTTIQGERGVGVDLQLLRKYRGEVQQAEHAALTALPWLDSAKPLSPRAVAEQCRKDGIPCPPLKTEDEEGYDAWVDQYADTHAWIRAFGSLRRVRRLLAVLTSIETRLRPNGTIGFSLKYFGSHTGRWSGDGGLNMQNMNRLPYLFDAQHRLLMQDATIAAVNQHEETEQWSGDINAVVDMRQLFVPRDARNKFCLSDLSQIEPRVLSWLAGDEAFLEQVAQGHPIYEAHARATMGWTGGTLKKENKSLYALAKARVLSLGYGCGAEKFIDMAWQYAGLRLTLEESTTIVADFRRDSPHTIALWQALEQQLRHAIRVQQDLEIELPSGRVMRYEAPRLGVVIEPDKDGKPRRRTILTAGIGGRRVSTYGGKLVENITQATARDVFAANMLRAVDAGVDVVFSIHDEGVNEVDPACNPAQINAIYGASPEWLAGCPIAAESVLTDHYTK
jgi:hypothetical protein